MVLMRRVALATCAAWLLTSTAFPQSGPPAAEEVEAAYLYQFGRYVEWPSDEPVERFFICVLGSDPFGDVLDDIVAGKAIDGRAVAIRRILGSREAQGCRILFVSPSEDSRLPEILKSLEGAALVTVGRGATFTRRGGMIAFLPEQRKVRFIINLPAVDAAGLRVSSQLLRVALRVER